MLRLTVKVTIEDRDDVGIEITEGDFVRPDAVPEGVRSCAGLAVSRALAAFLVETTTS